MRDPIPSEPKSTFPTFQVPQASAMRGRAPPVQVARAAEEGRADLLSEPCALAGAPSVISGSSCPIVGNSNIKMQSVTENCLLNSVTVPKKQRNDHKAVAHNNSDKLEYKFGALQLYFGQDIPNQKSDNLEGDLTELNLTNVNNASSTHSNSKLSNNETYYSLERLIKLSQRTRQLELLGYELPLRLCGGGESSLSTGTSGWGTPPSQQASNNNGKFISLLLFFLKSVLPNQIDTNLLHFCVQLITRAAGAPRVLPIQIMQARSNGVMPIEILQAKDLNRKTAVSFSLIGSVAL